MPGVTALSVPKCTSSCSMGGVTYGYKSAVTTAGSPVTQGAFSFPVTATDKAGGTGAFTASGTVDNTAPAVSAATVVTSGSTTPGFVRSGGTYIVYANASDGGSPASGISTVKTDVSGLTAGQTALTLSACTSSCTVGGVTYGYKSSSKTAGTLGAGPIGFTVTGTDKASGATTGSFSVAVDNTAPTVTAVAVATTTTGVPGWLRKSGAYNVYANASDAASGILTVKANVSTITSGQTALALSACTTGCTIGGVTYAWKSANKTAGSTLAAGAVSFTVTATDNAGNAGTTNGSATADNTAPAASGAAIATVATNVPGFVGQGRDYVVYGDASDAASGVFKLTAKVSALTTGQTALLMPACVSSCSAGGVAHGYTSATTTVNATLSAGSKTYTLTATDNAGNAATTANQTVVVDNTAPTVTVTFPTAGYAGGWLAGCGDGARGGRLRHVDRRDGRGGEGAGELPAVGRAEPLLESAPGDVLVGDRGALERDPRAAVLVVPDGGRGVRERHRLHASGRSPPTPPGTPPPRPPPSPSPRSHALPRAHSSSLVAASAAAAAVTHASQPASAGGDPSSSRRSRSGSASRASRSRASIRVRPARSGSRSKNIYAFPITDGTPTGKAAARRPIARLHRRRGEPPAHCDGHPRRCRSARTRRRPSSSHVTMPSTVANACQGATFTLSFRASREALVAAARRLTGLGRGAVRSRSDGHRQQGEWPDEHHRTSTRERVARGVRGDLRVRQELGALG